MTLVFVVALSTAATQPALLWRKSESWVGLDFNSIYIWQTYWVARTLYGPRPDARVRIALLGNSRIWFPGRAPFVKSELERLAPGLDARVDNLAIFGARVGDMEIISRHLDALDPTLVVITLAASDLVSTPWGKIVNPTGELLDIGWRDGPIPAASFGARADRWMRTIWPFYRFRRFERALLGDYVLRGRKDEPFPDRFESRRQLFDLLYGDQAANVEADHEAFLRDPTLSTFVAYLEPRYRMFGLNEPVPELSALSLDAVGFRVLDRLLGRLAEKRWSAFVLLMPENPLLEEDSEGRYHRPGFSERAAQLIRQVAERHAIRVVDGRRWMPAEAFLDLNHVMADLSDFEKPLAREILNAVDS